MEEEWRGVSGWTGYEVSSLGNVRGLDRRGSDGRTIRGRVLRQHLVCGYPMVELQFGGARRAVAVHRLVAEAFLGAAPAGHEVCHWDGDPTNNRVANLRWDTHSANMLDAVRHKREAVGM